MADKAQTPPPATAVDTASSPLTPNPKRARMSSPDHAIGKPDKDIKVEDKTSEVEEREAKEDKDESASAENAGHAHSENTESATAAGVTPEEPEDEEDNLEADDAYADSAFGDGNSDTTSVTSSIYQGYIENGRRYQTKREGEYWYPADEKQFISMEAAHITYMLLDHNWKNPLFRSPIPDTAQNILDVGTGTGIWAKDVADRYPSAVVQGVDLSPPPQEWVPPNCKFEVDDVLKPWDYPVKFDFIHMRDMYGSFSPEQWRLVYRQAYNNLVPGGWIEHLEPDIVAYSDNGTLPADSLLATWGDMFYPMMDRLGKPIDTCHHIKYRIEAAGFTNIHEKSYKLPLGDWVKDPVLKEAGRFCKTQLLEGMEGYVMFTLTNFGEPTPWTPEEVQIFLAKVRKEINTPGLHAYYVRKRVWAQKPFDKAPKAEPKTEVQNLA